MKRASDIIDSIKISDSTILDQKTNIEPHNNILMIAAANNLYTIVKKLLLKGANPLSKNDLGQTARAVCDERKNSATLEHLYLKYAQSSKLLQEAEQLWLQNDSTKPYNIETLLMASHKVTSHSKRPELNHYQYVLHAYPANQNPTISNQTAQTYLANSQPEDLSAPQISNTQNMLAPYSTPNTERSLGDFRK